jgi:hypothetical protein
VIADRNSFFKIGLLIAGVYSIARLTGRSPKSEARSPN